MKHFCKGAACGHSSHYDEGGRVPAPAQRKEEPRLKPIKNNELDNAGGWSGALSNVKKELFGSADDMPQENSMAEGGEVELDMDATQDVDGELMEMAADELCEAIEKKDKKGIVDAIKALVMSAKE